MTREDFRRDLGNAFDAISGSPSPALSDRVRSALSDVPERRGPIWIAGLAAALIAVLLVAVLVVGNLNRHQPVVPGGPATSPSPSTAPSSSPSPAPTSSPNASPFVCTTGAPTTQPTAPVAFIDRVQTGSHAGYDRVTIEFNNGQPTSIEIKPQSGTSFTMSPSGQPVTLAGQAGILVIIHGSDAHTAYSGPPDITNAYPALVEVRQLEDFEGTTQWGLGLAKPACYRAFMLTGPDRLVIDIQVS